MKKSLFLKAMFIILSFVLLAGVSPALAGDHPSCKIDKIGVYPGLESAGIQRSGYPIFLTCTDIATPGTMFVLSLDMGDAGLATALTAISLDKPVWVRTATDEPGALVTVMYLSK